MMVRFFAALAFMASLTGGLFLFAAATAPAPFKPLDALVKLQSDTSKCSGTHVGHGYVLTAAHCDDLDIVTRFGDRLATEVAFKNVDYDVAVLFANDIADTPRARITCKTPQLEQQVVVAGHPGRHDFLTFQGRVAKRPTSITLADGEVLRSVIGIDVTGMGGMSGGPVYVNGKIAAVFVAGPGYTVPTRSVWFATPLSTVCDSIPVPLVD
jgi:hypothetical protein